MRTCLGSHAEKACSQHRKAETSGNTTSLQILPLIADQPRTEVDSKTHHGSSSALPKSLSLYQPTRHTFPAKRVSLKKTLNCRGFIDAPGRHIHTDVLQRSSPSVKMTEDKVPTHYKACVYDTPGKISIKIDQMEIPEPVGCFGALSAFFLSFNVQCSLPLTHVILNKFLSFELICNVNRDPRVKMLTSNTATGSRRTADSHVRFRSPTA